ncbi:MAG: GNAT family N-acetyltransferase [Rhizobiales bacterium]|nr:GNAT family N-acetyltransferase [Hyphomicrobiales bacterium]
MQNFAAVYTGEVLGCALYLGGHLYRGRNGAGGELGHTFVQVDGEYAGFASLKGNDTFEMLYVHPHFAGQGVGNTLADAVERLAQGRGAKEITVEASDTAEPFFEARGYEATQRNMVPRDDLWLPNTTMKKRLGAANDG